MHEKSGYQTCIFEWTEKLRDDIGMVIQKIRAQHAIQNVKKQEQNAPVLLVEDILNQPPDEQEQNFSFAPSTNFQHIKQGEPLTDRKSKFQVRLPLSSNCNSHVYPNAIRMFIA